MPFSHNQDFFYRLNPVESIQSLKWVCVHFLKTSVSRSNLIKLSLYNSCINYGYDI